MSSLPAVHSALRRTATTLMPWLVATAVVATGLAVAAPAAAAADTTPPGKPSSIGATYFGGVGTVLTWGRVSASDLDGYQVYRSTSKSMTVANSVLIATTAATKSTDSAAPGGVTVYYAVASKDRSGNVSGLSSVKAVLTTDTGKPSTPSSLRATASASGVSLDWADNDEPDLAGYRVERGASSSGPWAVAADGISGSAYVDGSAASGAKTYYRVTAADRTGNRSSAATASATRPAGAPVAPAAPSGLTAALSGTSVKLSWTASPGATSYRVARSTSADGTFTQIGTPTSASFTDAAAPTRSTSFYRVTAANTAGVSGPSTVSIAVPGDSTPPNTPSSGTAKVLASGGMAIAWKANAEADLAGYLVQRRDSDDVYRDYLPTAGGSLPVAGFTDPAATEGTTTYYRVRAIDTSGNTSKGYLAITAKSPMVAPGTPSSFKVTQNPTAGLDLGWTAPKDTDLAGYSIFRSTSSSSGFAQLTSITATAAGSSPRFTDTSAPKGVTVYYRVVATDLVGNLSKNSSTVSGTSLTDPVAIPVDETVLTVGAGKQFRTVGSAVASVPSGSLQRFRIDIDPGVYPEHFEIASAFITLHGTGTDPAATVIEDARASGSADPDEPGDTLGTAGSAVVYVSAPDVTLRNLTVRNSFDEAASTLDDEQAVALRVEGDRFIADHVRLLGNQDTLLADTPKPTTRIRQYYVDSYIEGDVDFVFGAATAVFDRVTFRALDRGKSNNGYLTAASTDSGSKYGFLITDSKVVSSAAAGSVNLGRPWHPSADPKALGSVVIRDTWLPTAIDAQAPWDDMASSDPSGTKVNFSWQDARFDEYRNIGPGAGTGTNRPQLSDKDAANATPAKYLAGKDGWAPMTAPVSSLPTAPADVQAATDIRVVHLAWDDDLSAAVTGWSVWRAGPSGPFMKVGTASAPTFSDTSVQAGESYRYYVTADSRSGVSSPPSATVDVVVTAAPLVVDYTVDPAAPASATSFQTLAAALAAAPAGTPTDPTVIRLAAGRYAEYDTVSKPYTVLVGATGAASDVVITGDRAAGTPTGSTVDGVAQTYGTSGSATLVITASNVQLRDLTVENAYSEGTYVNGQAVALRTTGDRLVYDNVRLLGNQDTLYANSPSTTQTARTYIRDSWIQGDVDFVFGRGTVVIENSTLYALDHGTSPNGAVTAASTDRSNPYGILITGSRIIGTAPTGAQNLGRPWQPGQTQADGTSVADPNANAQVTVRDSWLGPVVSQTAWTDMTNSGTVTSWRSARFSEYRNAGPGAATGDIRPQLSDADATRYTSETYLAGSDGWNPTVPAIADAAPGVVTGLTAVGDDARIDLSWNDSPESDVSSYRIYRATGSDGIAADAAHLIAEVQRPTYRDSGLANGTVQHYIVVAVDRAGNVGSAGESVTATAAPRPLVPDVIVAADGTGGYSSVQAALDAVGSGTVAKPKVVFVKPGTYREVVASSRSNVILTGTTGNAADVVVAFDNANGTVKSATSCPTVTAATCGTAGSATVTLTGAGVQVRDLTIANTFVSAQHPEIGTYNTQAVALRATGDRQIYRNVRLLGVQDTLNADGAGNISADGSGYPRQYYVDSLIEGNVDFVFGRASAVFQRVTFSATAHNGGTIFAPSTARKSSGYLVVDSRIASANDPGTFALGRPWRAWSDGAYADDSRGQTVIRNTWLPAGISTTQPWIDFAPNAWTDGRFAEYGNTGPGAGTNANRPQLDAPGAAAAMPAGWLAGSDGWAPLVAASADAAPSAPSGLAASAGSTQAILSWTESIESDVTGYRVYRDGAPVGTVDHAGYVDSGVANDTAYRYTVTAIDAAGHESAPSAVVEVTPRLRIDATVSADGTGQYPTLQAAVDAAPAGGGWAIKVQPGSYAGLTTIAKPNLTIIGGGTAASDVQLTNGTTAPTVSVTGAGVTIRGLSMLNTSTAGNAPALSMSSDKVVIASSVISSAADRTVFADTPTYNAAARQLITGSTIIGGSDTVLGRATLVINDTTLRIRSNGTALTPSTAETFKGFLVINSTIDTAGSANVQLGRPYRAWADTYTPKSVGQAVVRDTVLGAGVRTSQPWGTGPASEPWTLGRFAEYGNRGDGAGTGATRPQLTPADSVQVTVAQWLGAPTWYPAVADPAVPADIIAPDAPSSLTATTGDGSAALTWKAPVADDLAGYRVYRAAAASVQPGPATLVATLGAVTTWSDTGLSNGTAYSYALVALDTAGNASAVATVSATPADTVPPAVPSGLTVKGGDQRAVLAWTANTEADLAGYRVYRDGAAVGGIVATAGYTDGGLVNGTTYGYTVSAVDRFGNESAQTTAVSAVPLAGDREAPAIPAGVGTVLGKGSVTVTWSANTESDLAGYDVLRDGAVVVTVPSGTTRYTDTTVVAGTAYRYSVVAKDLSGNASDPSVGVSVTPVKVDVLVDPNGGGDATSVAAGIALLPNNADYTSQGGRTVLVLPGTYVGNVDSGNRYGVRVIGATSNPTDVVLTSSTGGLATVTVSGAAWTFRNLTLQSVASASAATATALQIKAGDKQVLDNVRLLGDALTLNLSTANTTTYSRIYISNSYIEGGADLMLGRAVAVVDRSTIHVLNRPGASLTDSSIAAASPFGFLITDSSIVTDGNPGSVFLGRPYSTQGKAQVVVRDSVLGAAVNVAQPWKDWDANTPWTAGRFSEFNNSGPGAGVNANRPQLTADAAAGFTAKSYLAGSDGWNPTGR